MKYVRDKRRLHASKGLPTSIGWFELAPIFPVHGRFFLFSNLRLRNGRLGKKPAAGTRVKYSAATSAADRGSGAPLTILWRCPASRREEMLR
jgi:hypothetical protein